MGVESTVPNHFGHPWLSLFSSRAHYQGSQAAPTGASISTTPQENYREEERSRENEMQRRETWRTIAGPYRYGARCWYLPSCSPHRYGLTASYRYIRIALVAHHRRAKLGQSRLPATPPPMCVQALPSFPTLSRSIHHRYGLQVTGNACSFLPVTWGTGLGDSVMKYQ